jgi:hypothetical protein
MEPVDHPRHFAPAPVAVGDSVHYLSDSIPYNAQYVYQTYGVVVTQTNQTVAMSERDDARAWLREAMERVDDLLPRSRRARAQIFHDTEPEDL